MSTYICSPGTPLASVHTYFGLFFLALLTLHTLKYVLVVNFNRIPKSPEILCNFLMSLGAVYFTSLLNCCSCNLMYVRYHPIPDPYCPAFVISDPIFFKVLFRMKSEIYRLDTNLTIPRITSNSLLRTASTFSNFIYLYCVAISNSNELNIHLLRLR
jgi:hypothetical protein